MRRHSVRRRGRDSPQQSSVREIMTHSVKKEKLIVFIKIRKKSNDGKRMGLDQGGLAMRSG